jgi:HNH endonuclease
MKTKDYNSVNWNEVFVEDASSPTGLRWKISPARCAKAGDVAGSIMTNKKSDRQYFRVGYNKSLWLVHRILWVMRATATSRGLSPLNGEIDASLDIDHIDGNALNNSVENLRLVSTISNNRNKKQQKNNSTGVTGVYFWTSRSGTTYVRAQWFNLAGEREVKQFSCKKLGKDLAFSMACEYREKMLAELNASGAGYSERHGSMI